MKFNKKEYFDAGFIVGNRPSVWPDKESIEAWKEHYKKEKRFKGKKVSIRTTKEQDSDGKKTKYVKFWIHSE